MAQAGPRTGKLEHGISRRTRPGPSMVARFINCPMANPSLAQRFIAGLAPSLAISTRMMTYKESIALSEIGKGVES